jgi:hypothetical protein
MINYFSPQFEDKQILIKGFTGLWFINRAYHIKQIYLHNMHLFKLKGFTDIDIFNNLINNSSELIAKIDDYNFLTHNAYPYSRPTNSVHYLYWTKNNHIHNDVLKNLIKFNIIDSNTNYMIWQNSLKSQSIKTIKHYHIVLQQQNPNPNPNPNPIQNPIPTNFLKKIIIVARHGPREPILHLPKLKPFNSSIDNDINMTKDLDHHIIGAKLTPHGKEFCKNFGTYIGKIFQPYFNFDQEKTFFGSSDIDRAIESALCFHQGLFNSDLSKSELNVLNELMGDIILSAEEKIEYGHLHDNMKLKSIASVLDKQLIDQEIKDCFGYSIQNIKDYFNVISTIRVYQEHLMELPPACTPELIEKIDTIATEYYYELFSTKFKHIFTNRLIKLIKQIILNKDITFAYLSTHDVVVYPLVSRFTNNIIKLPEFCSSLRIEIWDNDTRIYYDDNLIAHLK